MSDDLNIDFSSAVKQVEEATKSLDVLLLSVEKLNRADLNRVKAALDALGRLGGDGLQARLEASLKPLDELEFRMAASGKNILKNQQNDARTALSVLKAHYKDIKESTVMHLTEANAVARKAATERQRIEAATLRAEADASAKRVALATQEASIINDIKIKKALATSDRPRVAGVTDAFGTFVSQEDLSRAKARLDLEFSHLATARATYMVELGLAANRDKLATQSAKLIGSFTSEDALLRTKQLYELEARLAANRDKLARTPERVSKVAESEAVLGGMREYYLSQGAVSKYATSSAASLIKSADVTHVHNLTNAFDKLTLSGNDVHSMARGLASGFDLLWLTWGNLVPLFAGAAISFGAKGIVKLGSDVDHTMTTIRVLSQESTESVQGLRTQLLGLSKDGIYGPIEVANAMKTMSLAGLDAKEVSASIKDVLNFAVAGTTDLKSAADVMTSVATAFGVSANAYNYVGDVITKTAAVSKSSVESIGEAFKTASVLHKQYGISLEDVGVGLAALSNLGIQGTAAGTALRNMYVDLSGRTPKVAAALKTLGLEYLARVANPAERQIIEAAQMDMLDAALTLGTGAAYTREQLEGYRTSYFPQLGDDPRTINAKSQRLNNLVNAAYEKAGRAAPPERRGAESQAPQDWIASGLDQTDWNALSEDDKKAYLESN